MSREVSMLRRLPRAIKAEFSGLHLRLLLARLLLAPLPRPIGFRIRALVLRITGFQLGRRTLMFGTPYFHGHGNIYRHLRVGDDCSFQYGCTLDLGADIEMGSRVWLGHEVMILTTTHDVGSPDCRCGPPISRPVRIEDGVWLCTRCIILPGVTVGAGSVVGAGAVVNRDVPPNTIVAGVPARVVKELECRADALRPFVETVVDSKS